MKNLNLSTKLIIALLLSGIIPSLVITFTSIYQSSNTIINQSLDNLVTIRQTRKTQLTDLFTTMEKQVITFSDNKLIKDAMRDFRLAFKSFPQELNASINKSSIDYSIKRYYKDIFEEKFLKINTDKHKGISDEILSSISNNAKLIQYSYISNNDNLIGEKHKLDFANDNTQYSKVHKIYHPTIRKFLEEFGYYDIFLVEPENGNIVYSTYKELDFGTSLLNGPYSDTNFADIFKKANASTQNNDVTIVDLKQYLPSYNAAAGFIASPIFDEGIKIGILIFQIPVNKIDSIMTSHKVWKSNGFGESGETYLVGQDYKMRSLSRFFIEDPNGYFKALKELGINNKILKKIKNQQSTTLYQEVQSKGVKNALSGKSTAEIFNDYRKVPVLSAYSSFTYKNLKWAILAEKDESEVLRPINFIKKVIFTILILCLVIITIIAVTISKGIGKPIINAIHSLKNTSSEVSSASSKLYDAATELSQNVSTQASSIEETASSLEELSAMVVNNVSNAESAVELSSSVKEYSNNGNKSMEQLKVSMREISDSNTKIKNLVEVIGNIGEKTKVVDEIVFQTKLLSFNASVEAERAGEAGKGFAVVAQEVGNLAQMSGKSAKEISDIVKVSIQDAQSISDENMHKVSTGNEIVSKTANYLNEILESSVKVEDGAKQVLSASKDQASGIKEINKVMGVFDKAIQENAASADKTANIGQELKNHTEILDNVVEKITTIIDGKK